MTLFVKRAQVFHDVAFRILPVVGSVAVFATAIVQQNMALYAVAAGMLGIPGITAATTESVEES